MSCKRWSFQCLDRSSSGDHFAISQVHCFAFASLHVGPVPPAVQAPWLKSLLRTLMPCESCLIVTVGSMRTLGCTHGCLLTTLTSHVAEGPRSNRRTKHGRAQTRVMLFSMSVRGATKTCARTRVRCRRSARNLQVGWISHPLPNP
jgi:hypothetical protein